MSTVTVVVPAYNEGTAFEGSLATLADYLSIHRAGYDFHYLIVDDGSVDETHAMAEKFARWRPNVRILRHDDNRGLGAALRTAFAAVDTDIAVVLDADLSYSPAVAMQLIEALERDGADIAIASPYAPGGRVVNVPLGRRLLSQEANRVLSLATSGRYATLTCMVRAFRTPALKQLEFRDNGMVAVAEMLLSGLRKKFRVVEVPATLKWSDDRRNSGRGIRPARVLAQGTSTFLLACRHRPSLWLAVPGLFPGLLPLVVAVLLMLRVSGGTLALGTTITIVVQYTSLALFSGQIAAFAGRKLKQKHQTRSNGVHRNGYDLPTRIA